jgi:hypothetical protein
MIGSHTAGAPDLGSVAERLTVLGTRLMPGAKQPSASRTDALVGALHTTASNTAFVEPETCQVAAIGCQS